MIRCWGYGTTFRGKTTMKGNTVDCWTIIAIVVLVILCAGEPDLLDAIISLVQSRAECADE